MPGPKGFAWRLSVADVETEGPFSRFEGLSRILTVIEGHGLELHGPDSAAKLEQLVPFHFSGEVEITSVLNAGPIRDFNVIYDSDLIDADVQALHGPGRANLTRHNDTTIFLFCVAGVMTTAGGNIYPGTLLRLTDQTGPVALSEGGAVLCISLRALQLD